MNKIKIKDNEYEINKKEGQDMDSYYIETRFPNINEVKIPNFSEERVDKL